MVTEIKRFVSYIYMYDNGIKGNNVGFAKVDSRNGQCKIAVNIKGLESSNGKSEKVYLFYRRQEKILGIYIGNFQIVNGIGEFHEQLHTQNIKDSHLSLEEMNGILVREEDKNMRVFASGWDDYAIIVNQFCVHNEGEIEFVSDDKDQVLLHASEVEEKRKEPIIFFDRTWKGEVTAVNQSTEAVQSVKEDKKEEAESAIVEKLEIEDKYGQGAEKQRKDYEREIKRGQKMDILQKDEEAHDFGNFQKGGSVDHSQEIKEEKEEVFGIHKEQDSEFLQQAKGVETVTIEGADGEKSRKNTHNFDNELKADGQQNGKAEAILEDGVLWGTYTPSVWKEISWEEYQRKEQEWKEQTRRCIQQSKAEKREQRLQQELQFAQMPIHTEQQEECLSGERQEEHLSGEQQDYEMQNQEETAWDMLCHQFPKIRAFVDEPESVCLKIDLQDLRVLPRENWGLGNNSFLLHGYYNFRYLILTQEKGRFVLGIPGIYHPNERVMASMFGFGGFKPVKVCDKLLGQFGYWYKPVTI